MRSQEFGRTQVYFPKDVYRRIEKKANKESKSSAAVVREAVERYLAKENKKEIDWDNDPFFKAAGFFASEEGDLSVNHDHYLYGAPKKTSGKKHG